MSLTPECLDNIIGLSKTTCDCFEDMKPSDFNESKSDIFLDELEGLNLKMVSGIEDCEEGNIWDILIESRAEAIKSFKADLIASLLGKYKHKRKPFSGVIGSEKFKTSLSISNNYAGVRIYSANIISGVMSIKRIGLVFDTTAQFDISIFDGIHDYAIATYTVDSQANILSWFNLPSPLNLAMNYEAASENPNYYILYTPSGFQPKDIKVGCGCSSLGYKYYWNTSNPMFRSYEKDRWSEYIMLTGTKGDAIGDRENWGTTEQLNGIIIDVDFKCAVNELICKSELDFTGNEIGITMAYAIRYKAGMNVLEKILASPHPNIYTMTDRERMMGKKNTYTKEYLTRISYLTEKINYMANDCLACDNFEDIVKVGILS